MTFSDLIHTVSKTGGHLGSSLGVVELTVALHHVFNTPVSGTFEMYDVACSDYKGQQIEKEDACVVQEDKIIWDVGHQAYIHKMLTGRRSKLSTIRQKDGLSGKGCKN